MTNTKIGKYIQWYMYINVGFLVFHIISFYQFLGQFFINYIFQES